MYIYIALKAQYSNALSVLLILFQFMFYIRIPDKLQPCIIDKHEIQALLIDVYWTLSC